MIENIVELLKSGDDANIELAIMLINSMDLSDEFNNIYGLILKRSGLNIQKFNLIYELCELNLSCCNIDTIPKGVFELTNLERLSLSTNKLTEIPKDLENLTKLKILRLQNNRIEKIPTYINKFPKNLIVYMSNNLIESDDFDIEFNNGRLVIL